MSRLGNVTGFLVGEIIRGKDKEFSAIKNAALAIKKTISAIHKAFRRVFSLSG
jgi:hypothetical protein